MRKAAHNLIKTTVDCACGNELEHRSHGSLGERKGHLYLAFTAIINVPFSRKRAIVPLLECFELKSHRTQMAGKLLTFLLCFIYACTPKYEGINTNKTKKKQQQKTPTSFYLN